MNTWNSSNELNQLLPKSKIFKLNGSIDRYGFRHYITNICDLKLPLRPFSEWTHGWIWDQNPTAEILGLSKLRRDLHIVVRNEMEKNILHNEGFMYVTAGGLPFSYIPIQHNIKNNEALLCFPPHSTESEVVSSPLNDYLDYLESLKDLFDGIYVSIFYLDWNGPIHTEAIRRGLNVIQGARPDDSNSLLRMRSIFDAFKYVTSNNIGSHFLYALYSGCNFSFCGPMFQYDESIMLSKGNPHKHSKDKIDRIISIQQVDYLKNRYGLFFSDTPRFGIKDLDYGFKEIGKSHNLTPKEIIEKLGWTPLGQLSGYTKSAFRYLNKSYSFLSKK